MIAHRYKLPNGNTLIWLGNQPIYECENVLILAGGDVLFLKPVKKLYVKELQQDMEKLSQQEFLEKYGWPNNSSGTDLFWELQKADEYPDFQSVKTCRICGEQFNTASATYIMRDPPVYLCSNCGSKVLAYIERLKHPQV